MSDRKGFSRGWRGEQGGRRKERRVRRGPGDSREWVRKEEEQRACSAGVSQPSPT